MADVQINLQASILQSIEKQSSFDAEPWAVLLVQNFRKQHASMHASKQASKKERKKAAK